jgi:hypothetical protein
MFNKEIEFSAHEDYFAQKEDYPIPAKLNIPEWFKKLEHTVDKMTVKGCMPFLDSLTSGYLLKIPQDFHIKHNIENNEGQASSFHNFALSDNESFISSKYINLNTNISNHPIFQLEGSPHIEKNKPFPFYKILNPWRIKTPKGYSCLFIPPLNNTDDRFSIIPAIVDTDSFINEINFPIVINGDKYPVLETIVEKGLPYVQIIPFKRESWKMTFKSIKQKQIYNTRVFYNLNIFNRYKNLFWKKKSWK